MSTTPGWPPSDPEPHNPFAAPGEDRATPSPAPGYPAAPPPSGYEAVSLVKPGAAGEAPAASAPTPSEAAPPSPYGSAPGSPYGSAPASPYGSAPASPYAGTPYDQPQGPAAYGQPGGAPGYGYGYGQPPGYAYPPPGTWGAQEPPVDGLAIASLATSCAAFVVGISGPVGLGLGIAALRRIRRTGHRGRGLAIAGIAVGAVTTLFLLGIVALIVWGITDAARNGEFDDPYSDSSSDWSEPYTLEDYRLTDALVAGECIQDYPYSYDLEDVVVEDCATEHAAEVIARVELTGPVQLDPELEDPVMDAAYDQCDALASDLAPDLYEFTLSTQFFPPHPDEWDSGGTSGYCVLVAYDGVLTGSILTGGLAVDGDAVTP